MEAENQGYLEAHPRVIARVQREHPELTSAQIAELNRNGDRFSRCLTVIRSHIETFAA